MLAAFVDESDDPNDDEFFDGLWAWVLEDPRPVKPIYMKGKLRFWDLDDDEIEYEESADVEKG
jgi:hypothetical protein